MIYLFVGGLAILAGFAGYNYLRRFDKQTLLGGTRWLVGGLGVLIAGLLVLARRIDIAVFVGAAAFSVLRTGRLGPFSFQGTGGGSASTISKVRSRYFAMELDHDSGSVAGRVLTGRFAGAELIDLGEQDTRALIAEVQADPDSISLLESWLDANRSGWREYFAETAEQPNGDSPRAPEDSLAEAYDVLGLKPGATPDEIRAAHRELMKAVHPDHGGSSYLASKINQARDRLLAQ